MSKYKYLFPVAIIMISPSFAQEVSRRLIEDSVLGWIKVYQFKGAKAAETINDRSYSAEQLSICDSFANWMQASYVPIGGLGDVKKKVNDKVGPYNKNDAALPASYGAFAYTYFFLKYNASRKLVPANNLNVGWGVMANRVPGWPVRTISTPSQYYFTMPSFEVDHDGETTRRRYDLTEVPNLKPYINFWIKDIEAGNGANFVLLCKDNRSPFIKLTKGQYLQALAAAIPRYYEAEKKKIYEQNPGNQRSIDYFMKYLDEKNARLIAGVKAHREKYKDRLNEIALTSAQPSVTDLDNARDVFSQGYLSDAGTSPQQFPVYKVDSLMAARCKENKPQWILVSWWWSHNDRVEKHLHESIINNFNFEYVYNFFFDPAKVKGMPYKPLRAPLANEVAKASAASETAQKNAADRNIYFFEDFSTTGIGKVPANWHTTISLDGVGGTIVKPDGLNGNWVMMNGDYVLTAKQLKKPFPQNFTLSYDLVAAQNFTWGAKGLTLQLSKEASPGNAESFLILRLRPGFDGREGETTIESKFPSPPGYANGTKWLKAPGFSNNKKNNRINVTIKKAGETLLVFIDNNKIAEYEKAIPASHLFNAMSFSSGSSGENNKYYISNIKITKD